MCIRSNDIDITYRAKQKALQDPSSSPAPTPQTFQSHEEQVDIYCERGGWVGLRIQTLGNHWQICVSNGEDWWWNMQRITKKLPHLQRNIGIS